MKFCERPKTEKSGGKCVPPYDPQGVNRISKYSQTIAIVHPVTVIRTRQ